MSISSGSTSSAGISSSRAKRTERVSMQLLTRSLHSTTQASTNFTQLVNQQSWAAYVDVITSQNPSSLKSTPPFLYFPRSTSCHLFICYPRSDGDNSSSEYSHLQKGLSVLGFDPRFSMLDWWIRAVHRRADPVRSTP